MKNQVLQSRSKHNRIDNPQGVCFLVEDGGIAAKAAVRYVLPGVGVGLQFDNIRTEDQPHFVAMMKPIIRSGRADLHACRPEEGFL